MINWLILACFLLIGAWDYKKRIVPNWLLLIIFALSFFGRTTIEILTGIGIGLAACVVGFVLYRLKLWSRGDVGLAGVTGLAFGFQLPYIILVAAITMIIYQVIKKPVSGLPLGVPVGIGIVVLTIAQWYIARMAIE